jgi:hypothetical protein
MSLSNEKIPDVIPMTQLAQNEDGETVVKRVRPLTFALMTFVKVILKMEDTIDISDDESSASWSFSMPRDEDEELNAYDPGRASHGFFTTLEDLGLITFEIYFGEGLSLSQKKTREIEHFIIETNNELHTGHIQILDGTIRYHASINVSGIASDDPEYAGPHLIPRQLFSNMFEYGTNIVAEVFGRELAEKLQS